MAHDPSNRGLETLWLVIPKKQVSKHSLSCLPLGPEDGKHHPALALGEPVWPSLAAVLCTAPCVGPGRTARILQTDGPVLKS